MKIKRALFFMIWILPLPLAAQAPAPITMDDEPHHHLALKNDVVKVFEVELQPRDSFLMHSHDTDDVSIVIGDSATVNVSPGKADVLSMSKDAEVRYSLSGRVHLVRNIGQTPYRFVAIDLLRAQTGARNLCGKQISGGLHASPEAFSVKVEPAPGKVKIDEEPSQTLKSLAYALLPGGRSKAVALYKSNVKFRGRNLHNGRTIRSSHHVWRDPHEGRSFLAIFQVHAEVEVGRDHPPQQRRAPAHAHLHRGGHIA
jgi:hypothetical protein